MAPPTQLLADERSLRDPLNECAETRARAARTSPRKFLKWLVAKAMGALELGVRTKKMFPCTKKNAPCPGLVP